MGQGGGSSGNPFLDFFKGIFNLSAPGGEPMPEPEPEPMIQPPTKQLPGYTSPAGQISLFGQMSPDELSKYNEQQGIATPKPPALGGGSSSTPTGGLWGDDKLSRSTTEFRRYKDRTR